MTVLERAALLNLAALRASGMSLTDYTDALKVHVTRAAVAEVKNQTHAAKLLGISRNTVVRNMKETP